MNSKFYFILLLCGVRMTGLRSLSVVARILGFRSMEEGARLLNPLPFLLFGAAESLWCILLVVRLVLPLGLPKSWDSIIVAMRKLYKGCKTCDETESPYDYRRY